MDNVKAVRFENKDGATLYGILESPESSIDRSIGIILLSPGIKMRVAPHQLYNKMSKKFVDLGYTVLRFDFYGLGDSEGIVEEELLADLYGSIQLGRYVDDTKSAIDWLEKECSINNFILAGLCGGAITGLLQGKSDKRVIGLLGLGIPVVLDSSKIDSSKYITDGQLDKLHKGYINRLFSLKSWLRLLSFQSDYKVIWKIITKKHRSKDKSKPDKQGNDNTNPLFAPAMFEFMNRKAKILFIFSGSDRLEWEYNEKFAYKYDEKLLSYTDLYEVKTIPESNHILSMPAWQHTMLSYSERWLNKYFNFDDVS